MRRLVRFPAAVGRTLWGFIHPARDVHQIPLGRILIALQLLVAVVFLAYTLDKKGILLPFSEAPYEIEVELTDAKGLDRVDEPGAAVAGAVLGRVTDVHYEAGQAVATLTLDADVRGKVFADASAEVRPASAIQNLIVNVDPGTPASGALADDERIEAGRSSSFVSIDELTGIFDADTRAYAQIVIAEAQRGLEGTENELGAALREAGELAETATPVSRALASRRHLLTELVGHLDTVLTTLGDRGAELGNAVAAGSDTLAVTAAREGELAELTRQLAPVLTEADRALAGTADLADLLVPALERLVPVGDDLARALTELRGMIPLASDLVDRFDVLTRRGAEPTELMLKGTAGLKDKVRGLIPTAKDLAALTLTLDKYRKGGAQLADTLSGGTSVNDRNGTYGQTVEIEFEDLKSENFGFGDAAARTPAGSGSSLLERRLAEALELACAENAYACLLRFAVPGLPDRLLSEGGGR
jgi:ABC-type transporter Mla subunit MlaD